MFQLKERNTIIRLRDSPIEKAVPEKFKQFLRVNLGPTIALGPLLRLSAAPFG
jgi:hypothetical protein